MRKILLPYAKPFRIYLIISVTFLFFDLLSNLLIPSITKDIIDTVFYSENDWTTRYKTLNNFLLYLGATMFLLAIAIYLRNVFIELYSQSVLEKFRTKIFSHMQNLDIKFYFKNTSGELMSRLTADIEQIRSYLSNGITLIAWNAIFFPLATAYMLYISWRLTLLCLSLAPIILICVLRFSSKGIKNQQFNRKTYSELSAVALEGIDGIRLVQGLVREKFENEKFLEKNSLLTFGRQRSLRNWAFYMPLLEVLGGLSSVLALALGGLLVVNQTFSLGTWIQFTGYTWMIVAPMRNMGDLINNYNLAKVGLHRIKEILDYPVAIKNVENPYIPTIQHSTLSSIKDSSLNENASAQVNSSKAYIEFRNVSWSPYERDVLHNINFVIPEGKRLGIIGSTGSGKSSIANLLCRFSDVSKGEILVEGIDIRQWDLRSLRQQIAYVMQEPFLFSETLSYNISFDAPLVSQEKIIRSAQKSAAHGFIAALQQGYQTIVGERGIGLSGGQRQRTALARALVKEAAVLILDDTTSAVDMETEKEIQSRLKDLDSHNTIIIISHRLSSVKDCDEIIVLDEGTIIERGSHSSLMNQDSYYKKIYKEQEGLDHE